MATNKKNIKVRDLKPKKDAKGGSVGRAAAPQQTAARQQQAASQQQAAAKSY